MNTTIDQLLTNVYELEGLLLVMQRHNDEVPQLVIDKFKEKAQHIAAQASIIDTIAQNAHTPEAEPVPPAFVPPTEHTDDSPAPAAAQPEQEPIIKPATPPKPAPKPLDEAKTTATTEPHSQLNGTPLRDITQAFSINDRFMFQRELFDGDKQKVAEAVMKARKQELVLETDKVQIPDYMKAILQKALAKKRGDRFASAADFAQALIEQVMPELAKLMEDNEKADEEGMQETPNLGPTITVKKGSGSGFDNVTGRDELKEQLRKEVLFALQNPEKAEIYKLPAINGILLYGPPGCGKSLVLQSFAEELGFHYSLIKGAEMGHIYQEGVLDNLQRLFDAAEIKAPFVICIDELEFIAPNAGEKENAITPQASALFGMMNECSKKGILVVATSNRPDLISPVIMRVGCIDRVFFVSQPDFEARKDIFMAHLKDRPCEELDFDELARMSDDFNAGDITETVNEAAMTAAYNNVPISQKILIDVLKYKNPTYSTKTRIGFNKN